MTMTKSSGGRSARPLDFDIVAGMGEKCAGSCSVQARNSRVACRVEVYTLVIVAQSVDIGCGGFYSVWVYIVHDLEQLVPFSPLYWWDRGRQK